MFVGIQRRMNFDVLYQRTDRIQHLVSESVGRNQYEDKMVRDLKASNRADQVVDRRRIV